MTIEESIAAIREEIRILPPLERQKLEVLLKSREGLRIISALEAYERSGVLSSTRFKQAIEDLYWNSR